MINPHNYKLAAILGRWQPAHLGHQAALHALCEQFGQVIVGIGSSNIHNYRNPFTLDQVRDMLLLILEDYDNFKLTPIPDTMDDRQWCEFVTDNFGKPDRFVTANPYVKSLLNKEFSIAHPSEFIPEEKKVPVSGTMVRREMARGDGWKEFVSPKISAYILENKLDESFRQKFGLQILALDSIIIETQ